jgi:hypothetical protein
MDPENGLRFHYSRMEYSLYPGRLGVGVGGCAVLLCLCMPIYLVGGFECVERIRCNVFVYLITCLLT